MKYNELKEKLEGYLLENVNELMVLIDDICSYNYKSKLEYLQAYSMEEVNEFALNYDFTDLFQMIDFKEFTIDDDYFNINTYGYIVSYTEEELKEIYRIEFDTIFNVIIEEIKKYGYETVKENYYFSLELQEIFNSYIENNNLK